MFEISINNELKNGKNYSLGFFIKAIKEVVAEEKLSNRQIGLSINLVGKARIKSLNKKFRNKNKATDVLSFPLHQQISLTLTLHGRAHRALATGAKKEDGAILELGDIFLCLPLIEELALREKANLDSRIILLTVHGCLHLLGYDHEKSAKESEKMFALQNKIIKNASTTNSLRN